MPAAAVIPALERSVYVVAVKKLVVEFLLGNLCRPSGYVQHDFLTSIWRTFCASLHGAVTRSFILRKLECFKQALL